MKAFRQRIGGLTPPFRPTGDAKERHRAIQDRAAKTATAINSHLRTLRVGQVTVTQRHKPAHDLGKFARERSYAARTVSVAR